MKNLTKRLVYLRKVNVQQFGDNEVFVRGLNRGELVVTAGVHKLRAGQIVRTGEGGL